MIALYVGWSVTVCILRKATQKLQNSPEPSGKAKYIERPIANKYREGKVKRTLNKGSEIEPETRMLTSGRSSLYIFGSDGVPFV